MKVEVDDIREDISEEGDKVDINANNNQNYLASTHRGKDPLDKSIRRSFEESEVDGLIKWAKDLPEDLAS